VAVNPWTGVKALGSRKIPMFALRTCRADSPVPLKSSVVFCCGHAPRCSALQGGDTVQRPTLEQLTETGSTRNVIRSGQSQPVPDVEVSGSVNLLAHARIAVDGQREVGRSPLIRRIAQRMGPCVAGIKGQSVVIPGGEHHLEAIVVGVVTAGEDVDAAQV